MKDIKYKIEFFSDWNCGSGLSAGADVDSLVIKNNLGLPFVPGKTIKGLLRDAAYDLIDTEVSKVDADLLSQCFGIAPVKINDKEETRVESALSFFTNAQLAADIQNYFENTEPNSYKAMKKESLYRKISSTKIDSKRGVAEKNSLRKIQVSIPLELYGEIQNVPEKCVEGLSQCMKMIKRLGTSRNRGFGRCKLEIIEQKEVCNA